MNSLPPLRQPCPPGVCICRHRELLDDPRADLRVLLLTRHEERRLLERLESIRELSDLERLQRRMHEQLGIRLTVEPGHNEVRSMRGLHIQLADQPGLCRKTRKAIPAAIRRALEAHPEVAWRLLDSFDLLGGG
jgi:Trp operon repressor